ncbi:MAG: nitrous oxide reductase accessory protein NosL [Sulfurospirillaceae bacterium]|nr:nitrous oxide reductase accessory protein NosL [Sulfurospirillaceae bacterium]
MKKIILITLLLLSPSLFAQFIKHATTKVVLVQKDQNRWCPITGQSIIDYYKTSFISKLKSNQNFRQYSSLTALAIDNQRNGIDKTYIKALDVVSQKYINAKNAFYLVNSNIAPTFGKIGVLAFEHKNDALIYAKKYDGKILSFNQALSTVEKNLKSSIAYMHNIYKKKNYNMGKRIYLKKCKKIDPNDFIEINDLKKEISDKNLCGKLNERYLQALSLYLWDVKRDGEYRADNERVIVKKDEKCPVCGMFTYKYPRWAAQIFFKYEGHEHHLSFDGVKDMMKFYFDPTKWGKYDFINKNSITKMLVTDYYSQKAIEARDAYFVEGSNIYGPMGHELIPFSNKNDAENFKLDHKGTKVLNFKEIKKREVYDLDDH